MITKIYSKILTSCLVLWLIVASPQVFAQGITPLGPGTYTSIVAGNGVPSSAMVHLDFKSIYTIGDPKGGIRGNCSNCHSLFNERIELAVYAYDPTLDDGKGAKVYDIFHDRSNTDDLIQDADAYVSTSNENTPFPLETVWSDIKGVASRQKIFVKDECKTRGEVSGFWKFMNWFFGNYFQGDCVESYQSEQPVIVELFIPPGSSVSEIKIPGINGGNTQNALDFFESKTLSVRVNGHIQSTISSAQATIPTIHLNVGDDVDFVLHGVENGDARVTGVPQVWLSHFAGESKYYCSPSITPGEYNPWIGFDSNVHGSALRRYDQFPDFDLKVSDWTTQGSDLVFSWTAQRRMNANKVSAVTPVHVWNKQKTLSNGKMQRNNQKEGLDMELLRNWPSWSNVTGKNSFSHYKGVKYQLGLDPDEILYINSQYPATTTEHPPSALVSPSKLKNGKEQWQNVPNEEGDGSAVNWMITAYRKAKGHYNTFYDGYEIQDNGTSAVNPNGDGTGNNRAPGVIAFTIGGSAIKFRVNNTAPFTTDRGFYGHILGPQWPAQDEKQVPYTLTDIISSKVDNYILEYENVNSFGIVTRQTYALKDETQTVKNHVINSGNWTKNFDISSNSGYNTVTAYYKRTPASKRVMIAGKELLEIQLRFVGSPGNPDPAHPNPDGENLNEDRGEGGYIYVEEYRTDSEAGFDYQRFGRFVDPYVTTYTFPIGTETSFSTLDGDPHTFIHSGTEWYLSERTQAKRIPAIMVNENLHYYVDTIHPDNTITDNNTPVGSGRTLTHTWNTAGTYRLRVVYNAHAEPTNLTRANYVFHKVNVVDYSNNQRGRIVVRDLTASERSKLGVSGSHWMLARATDVYSSWKFKDGPRAVKDASTNQQNRFAMFNDYADAYTWKAKNPNGFTFSNLNNPTAVQSWINDHNNLDWFPHNWVRHYNPDNPAHESPHWPEDVDTRYFKDLNKVTGQIDALFTPAPPESWQQRFRWISTTPYQGPRIRTNIKVIYNMQKFFDNQTGAFSGTPVVNPSAFSFWSPSDDQQDEELFYYDLLHGRAVVFDINTADELQVWNPDPANPANTTLIAGYSDLSSNNNLAREAPESNEVETPEEPLSPQVNVFPNPSSDWIVARVALPEAGNVEATLIDLKGNTLFDFEQSLDQGWNTLNIDASTLSGGIYILKVKGQQINQSERIIIN